MPLLQRISCLASLLLLSCSPTGTVELEKSEIFVETEEEDASEDSGAEPDPSEDTGGGQQPDSGDGGDGDGGDGGSESGDGGSGDGGDSTPGSGDGGSDSGEDPEDECIPEEELCDGLDNDCDGMVDGEGVCPCTFESHDGSSYLFCGDSATWQDARTTCQDMGYDLAVIGSEDENLWIYDRAADILGSQVWIGLHDLDEEGSWFWVDGSAPMYTAWADNEPNDWGDGEDCAEMLRWEDPTWNDSSCAQEEYFICELP